MSPSGPHCRYSRMESSMPGMHHRLQIPHSSIPSHWPGIRPPNPSLVARRHNERGLHHGFMGESILGGLLDFFECGLALLLQLTALAPLSIFNLIQAPIRLPKYLGTTNLRSPLFPFPSKVLNYPHYLFSPFPRINLLPTQTHTHFLIRPDH
jgi:hypothetical protein